MDLETRTEIVVPLRVGPETGNESIAAAITAAVNQDLPPGATTLVRVEGAPGALASGEGASIALCFSDVEARGVPLPRLARAGPGGVNGRLDLLRLTLHDVRVPEGTIDFIELCFPGAGYWLLADGDCTRLRLVDMPGGTARVTVSAAAICRLVRSRVPAITDPEVRFEEGGWVEASGGIRLGVIPARARLRGRVVVRGRSALCLADLRVRAGALALPAPLAQSVEAAVNPLVDLAKDVPLPFDVSITQVTTGDGSLRLDARVSSCAAPVADGERATEDASDSAGPRGPEKD